jgi:hypothetical protein
MTRLHRVGLLAIGSWCLSSCAKQDADTRAASVRADTVHVEPPQAFVAPEPTRAKVRSHLSKKALERKPPPAMEAPAVPPSAFLYQQNLNTLARVLADMQTDSSGTPELLPMVGEDAWLLFAQDGSHADPNQPPEDLRDLLTNKLVDLDGIEIVETRATSDRGAYPTCKGKTPVIAYSGKLIDRLTPYSFAFIREHEHAHFLLDHVRCSRQVPAQPVKSGLEQEADCSAVRTLEAAGAPGWLVIGAAGERFHVLDNSKTEYYPSGKERSAYILRRCKPVVQP